jgi:hypothetical protein
MTFPCKAGLPALLCPLLSGSGPSLPGSVSTLLGANSSACTVHSRASVQACVSCTSEPGQTVSERPMLLAWSSLTRHRNR